MYLGVTLDDHLSWSTHVTNVASKATRMLNFLKCHLTKCSTDIKTSAYLLLVRPLMEYPCVVWDPHYIVQITLLEKDQRRAARWVHSDYNYQSSISTMLEQLNWLPLAKRRKQQRLNIFYQITHDMTGLFLPDYYHFATTHTRQHHPFHLMIPSTSTTAYMTSFFLKTIREWNALPMPLIEMDNLTKFSEAIIEYL